MSIPYFPMYPADFEADTSHLTLEEDGAYNRLLRLMWMTPGCSLPNDPAWIARRMRVDFETFCRVISPLIEEFLTVKNGRIISPRLRAEYEKADETYRKRSEAGKKGGRPKGIENKSEQAKAGLSLEKAGPKQPEPEPEPEPFVKEDTNVSSKKRAALGVLMDVLDAETAAAFIAHRKAKRAVLTPHAASLIVAKIRNHPDPAAVINHSIMQGWTGVFPDSLPKPATAPIDLRAISARIQAERAAK